MMAFSPICSSALLSFPSLVAAVERSRRISGLCLIPKIFGRHKQPISTFSRRIVDQLRQANTSQALGGL